MSGTEYGKIETLYNRDKETFKVDPALGLRLPEFGLINKWLVTEKIDGTNIRIGYYPWRIESPEVAMIIKGRTDNADIPPFLLESIKKLVTVEKMHETFDHDVVTILYGEGYGERIQKGGGNYRKGTSFRLFDVKVGDWWLNWDNVVGVAESLGIKTVPFIKVPMALEVATGLVGLGPYALNHKDGYSGGYSVVAQQDRGKADGIALCVRAEGVVARTDPLLFTRRGDRLMWKLKGKDVV